MSVDYLGPLVGSWKLASQTATFTDNGEAVETFGPNPSGRMVLTAGGRISFLITRSNRRTPIDDAERAQQFDSMISYSGTVRSDVPGQFVTTVDVSLVPSEIGGEKLRLFSVDGNDLTIRVPEQIGRFGHGRKSASELTWVREPPIPNPDFAALLGGWRLSSAGLTLTETNERLEPWGSQPEGRMVLDASGRIMFVFTSRDRRSPTNDADRAGLVKDLMAYTGPIRLVGAGRFITTVDVAAHPAIAREQLRLFKIDGDRLTVVTEEVKMTIAQGRPVVGDVVFIREHPAAKS
jgi:Lipocalin-like domain